MTLEEAIRHAEDKAQCGGQCGVEHEQLAMWLKELQERRAAELEKRTEEHTETHACDTISRQKVIDALYDWSEHSMTDAETWHIRQVIGDIKSLPPAESNCSEIPNNSDCISRQTAITAIQKAYVDTEGGTDKCAVWKNVGLTNALHIMQDLPSVQPEIEERREETEHFVPKEDLISRKAAIEALSTPHGILYPIRTVEELSSAQSEIIRCKECLMHGVCRFEQGLGLDGYCSQAERRTDENNNE